MLAVPVMRVIWARMVVMVRPALAGTAFLSIQKDTHDRMTSATLGRYIVTMYIVTLRDILISIHNVV